MAKTEKPDNNKKQKHFWKDFKAELKKVIWPTRSQIVNNTIIVIVIVAIVTALCFVLDFAFEALNTYGIDKLKATVQGSNTNELIDENTVVDNNSEADANVVEENSNVEEDSENNETEN